MDNMDPLMTFWVFLIGILIGVILAITLVHKTAVSPLHKKIEKLTIEKESLSSTLDKAKEQNDSFMEKYPYSTKNFRFIGSPIDGIQFEEDQILFVKFKPDKSKINAKQTKIKRLVKEGKVKWFEFNMK